MNFCPQCQNLMVPKPIDQELWWVCKKTGCGGWVKATSSLVYSRETRRVNPGAFFNPRIVDDPTIPKKALDCPNPQCLATAGHATPSVCFFPNNRTSPESPVSLRYVCRRCKHTWTQ